MMAAEKPPLLRLSLPLGPDLVSFPSHRSESDIALSTAHITSPESES